MISAWDVYWVLQLDSIAGMFVIAAIIFGLALIFTPFFYLLEEQKLPPHFKKMLATVIGCALVATFLPSSKTAAAMILVPALTAPEVVAPVTGEAKELYSLAKQALKDLANKTEEEKPRAEND